MKILFVLSATLAVVGASVVPVDETAVDETAVDETAVTAYDYHRRFGIPNAENIKKFEESVNEEDPSRISGPSIATQLGQHPYYAGLLITVPHGVSICGAALLSNTRLVTAAHCWFDGFTQASMFTVVLGTVYLFSGGTRRITDEVYVHRLWNPDSLQNDVAIIVIERVNYSQTIRFIPLPLSNEVSLTFHLQWGMATGFGVSEPGGTINGTLLHNEQQVITNAQCQESYGNVITDKSVCTSGTGYRGICSGDTGGPLVMAANGRRFLGGIASFGLYNCTGRLPSVFTRVGPYTPWILDFL